MALYSLYQNKNEKMTGSFQKWYARPVVTDTKSLTDVALEIQENTTAKEADAYAVLKEMKNVLIKWLKEGYRIKIEGLGSFKLGLRSKGADSVEKFSVTENIKSTRVIFTPEVEVDSATGKRYKPLIRSVRWSNVESLANKDAVNAKKDDETPEP